MRGLEIEVRRRREEGLKEEGWRVWKGRTKVRCVCRRCRRVGSSSADDDDGVAVDAGVTVL